jgi:hypothetical protein
MEERVMSFRDEPLKVKIYIFFVVVVGLIFLLSNIPNVSDFGPGGVTTFLFFVILHIVLEQLDIPLPRGNGTVSVNFAIDIAIIILFGPAVAAWISFTNIIHFRTFRQFAKIFHKMLFNAFQIALTTGIAGYVYLYAGGVPLEFELPHGILPVGLAAVSYFILNSSLVLIVITLSQNVSFWGVWLTNFRWAIPNYFATLPLGILIAAVYINVGTMGILLMMIPLMIARHTFIMYMDMRNQYLSTIKALTKAIDAKDHYTHGHSERVAQYTVWIGEEMKLPEDFLEKLEYLALMHDIGKISIPESILNKPSRLSDEEFDQVRSHSAVGADIISNIKYIGEHADIVRHHHERMDGRGYPDGLTKDQISLGARIVGAADSFDAMTSKRVYSKTMSKKDGVEELRRCTNSQFCPQVVDAFIKVLERKGELS